MALRQLPAIAAGCALLLSVGSAGADDRRARTNYMIHCQGCHLPDATGTPGRVPALAGSLGYFLSTPQAREFVLTVPGVATSSLPDDQLAEVVNWILRTLSEGELPNAFQPYTQQEVAAARETPEMDVIQRRAEVVRGILSERPELATQVPEAY